jgi:3-phosphoshikimate 1-carboxyvinyltransferase
MIATFKPCRLAGTVEAPPSKSMAHRYLIGAALSGNVCTLSGIDYSEDILATIDCLKALGASVTIAADQVIVDPRKFLQTECPVLECRESGSTLRFFLPLALCLGKPVTLRGSQRLLERPMDVYENLCHEQGFLFRRSNSSITVCGKLQSGTYTLRGNISSQFITGMIFALLCLGEPSSIRILPPFESRSYVDLTLSALHSFGADLAFTNAYTIVIDKAQWQAFSGRIEGDYSNAAFLDAFNYLGSNVPIGNLKPDSLQGDRVYKDCFRQISEGTPTLDISDCPDLGPILFALAAMKNGAIFTGTDRLKDKESNRGLAMHEELQKLGGGLVIGKNTITVPHQTLKYQNISLSGHNDHRIVMALSIVLSRIGGSIDEAEAVRKSYPRFFQDIKSLGANVEMNYS